MRICGNKLSLLALMILVILISCMVIIEAINYSCPCSFPPKESYLLETNDTIRVCIRNYKYFRNSRFGSSTYNSIKFLYGKRATSCHIILNVSTSTSFSPRLKCPGLCRPVPVVNIPVQWLKSPSYFKYPVLCSLEQSAINLKTDSPRKILETIIYRRLQECFEQKEWFDIIPQKYIGQRKIFSLIIWIGSVTNLLQLYLQQSVLSPHGMIDSNHSVIGWLATESIYPCRNNTHLCNDNEKRYYLPNMPSTFMGRAQSRSLGWSCAQRRLLRALAHALLLYDPELVIIGDDDTYINYKLIAKVLHPVVNSRRYENPLIVGKLEYMGKISPQGFFHGGGGYIFGKKLVQRLTARKLYDPFFMSKDFYAYYKDLSVVEEVKALNVHCAPGK